MNGFLRRLRGAVGTALTWAVGWAGISAFLGAISGLDLGYIGMYALSGAFTGAFAGGSFAVLLSVVERKHTLEELSLKRVALWGGIGAMLFGCIPLAFGMPLGLWIKPLIIDGLIGAGFASGSVALAKGASDSTLLGRGDGGPLRIEGD